MNVRSETNKGEKERRSKENRIVPVQRNDDAKCRKSFSRRKSGSSENQVRRKETEARAEDDFFLRQELFISSSRF